MTAYQKAKNKLRLELLLMAPFVWLGKLAGELFPLKTPHRIFLFFPNADIGGTPRVNLEITRMLQQENPLIIFSKKAHNNQLREPYEKAGVKILDVHSYIDNKFFHFVNFFFRGVLATWINKQPGAIVFGGESIFFYKIIPHLRKEVRRIELTHVDRWLPYTIAFADKLDARIFSTNQGKEKAAEQYRENDMPPELFQRLHFIDNAIDIPLAVVNNNERLQVFFIGRGAAQKRVHLAAAIAAACHAQDIPADFHFVGDVHKMINTKDFPFCHFHGMVKDEQQMQAFYQQADVLLMTSSFEGLPLVVMHMMAHGKVVVSTAVSGIPTYIHHKENGLLIKDENEEKIISDGVECIRALQADRAMLQQLGTQARADAIKYFSREQFEKKYREIFGLPAAGNA